jgi:hypothetical protein
MGSKRDRILARDDIKYEPVYVPEWEETVLVRSLTAAERDEFEEKSLVKKGKTRELTLANIRARLVVLTACDEDKSPLFRPNDTIPLSTKNGAAVDRLFSVAQRLSGLSNEDIEEVAKNSVAVPSEDSGSN